jgi:hypothetical protein
MESLNLSAVSEATVSVMTIGIDEDAGNDETKG